MARSAKGPDEIQKTYLNPGKAGSDAKRGVTAKKGEGPAKPTQGSSTASARSGKRGVISVPRSRPLPRKSGPSLRLEPTPKGGTTVVPTPAAPATPTKIDKKAARLAQIRALAQREQQPAPARPKSTRASARAKVVSFDDPDVPASEAEEEDPAAESPTSAATEPEATIALVQPAIGIAELEASTLPPQPAIVLVETEADNDVLRVQPAVEILEADASINLAQPATVIPEPEATVMGAQPAFEMLEAETSIDLAQPATMETPAAEEADENRQTRSVLRAPPHTTLADLLVTMRPQTPPVTRARPKKTGPGWWLLSKLGQLAETLLSTPRGPRRGAW